MNDLHLPSSSPPPLPDRPPHPPSVPPVQVMSYATRAPTNGAAVLSLVFGLLFFIPLAVPGVLAVVFGRRGLRAAREEAAGRHGLARAGIVLGVINLALSLIVAAAVPFTVIRARQQAQAVGCMVNLRTIGVATMVYASSNNGFFPRTIDHLVPPAKPAAFICPACQGDPAKPAVQAGTTIKSHYHFVPPAPRITQVKDPARTVLAYEPPTNHDGRRMHILFCDGHVEAITGPAMTQIAAELAAGQNPPPSTR